MPHHSGTDFEVLRLAISQLRAERQAQQQQQQAELSINPIKSFLPNPIRTGSHLLGQGGPSEPVQHTPGKKAVAATLDLIHSALQPELGEEEQREDGAEGRRRGGSRGGGERGDQRDSTPVRTVALLGGGRSPSSSDMFTPSSNQNIAAVTGPSNQTASTDQQGKPAFPQAAKHGATSSCTTTFPAEGDRPRSVNSNAAFYLQFSL